MKIKIIDNWDDSLIGCPSQCYLKLEWNNQKFVIYLRWRSQDPWKAYLIQTPEDWNLNQYDWIKLEVQDYSGRIDDNLNLLKEESLKIVKKLLHSNTLNL